MTRFETRIEIAAPSERVWAVLADVVRWPEWTTSMARITPVGPAGLVQGTRYRVEQPRLRPALFTVTAVEPGRSFTWAMRSPGVRAVAVHAVTPTSAGCTVRLELEYSGPLGGLVGLLAGGLTREYMQLEAEGLKARSEGRR